MKHKSQLRIIEQTIMILVFAIAAAICLKAFFTTSEISAEIRIRDQAVSQVRNTAETLKATAGNFEKTAELLGGTCNGDGYLLEQEGFTVRAVQKQEDGCPPEAEVLAADDGGTCIFSITVAWQEENG